MSSTDPLWFCHECQAEMRPLMVPDPVCASCRGSFVEKMEDPNDDPRNFSHPGAGDFDDDESPPPGMDAFLLSLQSLIDRGIAERNQQSSSFNTSSGSSGNGFSFQFRSGSSQRHGANSHSLSEGTDSVPTMSEFIRRGPTHTHTGGTIAGPLMAQYLMALLGRRDPLNDFFGRGSSFGDPALEGRLGDYVFNQEALDQVITQIMENSNAHRPVPATDEIIAKLPREVLEIKSPMLERDCAVCKEQFKLETEDPDEQIVISLPCKHPFHEPCILPWLKSSGTCPVCRHALIAQPDHHPTQNSRPQDDPSTSDRGHSLRENRQDSSGILYSIFNGIGGGSHGRSPSRHGRSNSDSTSSRNRGNGHIPGGWSEELD